MGLFHALLALGAPWALGNCPVYASGVLRGIDGNELVWNYLYQV